MRCDFHTFFVDASCPPCMKAAEERDRICDCVRMRHHVRTSSHKLHHFSLFSISGNKRICQSDVRRRISMQQRPRLLKKVLHIYWRDLSIHPPLAISFEVADNIGSIIRTALTPVTVQQFPRKEYFPDNDGIMVRF